MIFLQQREGGEAVLLIAESARGLALHLDLGNKTITQFAAIGVPTQKQKYCTDSIDTVAAPYKLKHTKKDYHTGF